MEVRHDALAGLENFGIEIDDVRNANEELAIARSAFGLANQA